MSAMSLDHWNFDMDAAPKGEWRDVETKKTDKDGNPVSRKEYVAPRIIAASKCGVVTTSYWHPETERWSMFNADSPPIAWQPWPEHPNKSEIAP